MSPAIDVVAVPDTIDYGGSGQDGSRLIAPIIDGAIRYEAEGFDRMWVGEVNNDAMLPLLLAAEHTRRLEFGTAIVTAFPRSPMHLALTAHDLQLYSRGRFTLGLGSQVRAHVERRFSGQWGRPVARMREFVQALRAIWASWNDRSRLQFEGEFFRHTLMPPAFTPPPSPEGAPKIYIAAVGSSMAKMAGEVGDGVLVHGFTTDAYLREVTVPHVLEGLKAAGRDRNALEIAVPAMVATGRDDRELAASIELARATVGFYASTPTYRTVLEHHGWGDLQDELNSLARRGHWGELAHTISDEVLETFVMIGTPDIVARRLKCRFAFADRALLTLVPGCAPDLTGVVIDAFRQA